MFFFGADDHLIHEEDRPGEDESLPAKYIHSNLKIVDLFYGTIFLEVQAPEEGWSIQSICNVKLPMETKHGADAYLDDLWLTSTEV
ncbi:hypothetical protein E4188_22295 (plasmid) [Aeromonas media]|uniref:Uncharacterized protein n=1 Tax=Aeromonas media TaxID=651 RepID=A0ABX6NXX1_AERME|nr:hypothetical protein [Aeromonas media]QJT37001.1 hypothetical protein E4187_22165 [Aeromonas media]QJT41233.1 hypothetical protein E4188_22295 [Aeromonas media]